MTQHLLFNAAGLNLAAPAEAVKAIHEKLDVQPVAGTKRWFAGLAVANGKLLPVTDVGVYSGRRSSTGRTLELDPAAGIAGLRVDNVVGLSDSPVSDAGQTQPSGYDILTLTGRVIVQDEHSYQIVDIAALVQSAAFLNIAESEV
ncbi:MAG: chemotaxis protein CheW [Granulosicoccus sp.]